MKHILATLFLEKDSKIEKLMEKSQNRDKQWSLNFNKLYTSCMPDTKHPKCQHPKCGAKMQRIYKRTGSTFASCGWLCTDCGLFKKDELTH